MNAIQSVRVMGGMKDADKKKYVVGELHHAVRKNFKRRKTQMRGINDTIQADLIEMIPYAQMNAGKKYILAAINIFTKKAYARPLKSKSAHDVSHALEDILNSMDHTITHIHTDQGKEFYNGTVRTMLKQYNIHLYSTFTHMKAAIVERFIRTIKNKLWKQFSMRGSYKWINILPKLINEYNNTIHRTIKMRPNDVDMHNEQNLLDTVYRYTVNIGSKQTPKFKVGDSVRLSKYKHVFEKGYTPNWTTEVFKIKRVQIGTHPTTYILEDYSGDEVGGAVYEYEILNVKYPDIYLVEKILRRRGGKVYVKWLGFGSEFNQWIDAKDFTE